MVEKQKSTSRAEPKTEESQGQFLEVAMDAIRKTDNSPAPELLETFVEQALKGTITFDRDLPSSIENAIEAIDEKISKQLAAVMHHPDFQKLEGSWRGLLYLVMNSETGTDLRIRFLDCSKSDLQLDLESAVIYDQSEFFNKVYTSEFCLPGGTPYGAMIGDYEFTNHPDDIEMLNSISNVAAAAFCPFLSAASPNMFGFDDWTRLNYPRDLKKIFDSVEYDNWKRFRESDESRYVVLTLPRTLARLSYSAHTEPSDEFQFEEVELGADGKPKTGDVIDYCWMNTAYVMGGRLTDAFAQAGWCTAIRGFEGGGRVDRLASRVIRSEYGDFEFNCSTDVCVDSDRREKELCDCGFLPLCQHQHKDVAVFFGGSTAHQHKIYDGNNGCDATANAAISARLPYIMATSRFAHYLKIIGRDKIGEFLERDEMEKWMNDWILNYVSHEPMPTQETKARYPLSDARIEMRENPGSPGSYNAVVHIRPWLQYEELTASMTMIVRFDTSR